ncbi:DUF3870 domain-containing protein [Ornithinimicrobium sp. Y1847]|uniref:DUF3870 domain-containing protein n=1 Tax=Ornithinimicrobium sp. Y1847 TaxID=3405419 RepID=UPI003B673FF2
MSSTDHGPPPANGTVLVTGYSAAPSNTGSHAVYGQVGVIFEIDRHSHTVVDASFLVVTPVAQEFLRRIVLRRRLPEDAEQMMEDIRTNYLAPSANALAISVRNAARRFTGYLEDAAGGAPADPAS